MGLRRGGGGQDLLVVLCLAVAAACLLTTQCDARSSRPLRSTQHHPQAFTSRHPRRSSQVVRDPKKLQQPVRHLEDYSSSDPYSVRSPFYMPPYNDVMGSPSPSSSPGGEPLYCINPPPPSPGLPAPVVSPLLSPPPPSTGLPAPVVYPAPSLPVYSPPPLVVPSPPGYVPGPPEVTPTPIPPVVLPPTPPSYEPSPPEYVPGPVPGLPVPSPPEIVPSPPEYVPTPPISVPNPPGYAPSPPENVPSPAGYVPSPPEYVPSPVGYVPSPPVEYVPSPVGYVPSPPEYVPSPVGYVPSPPAEYGPSPPAYVFQPPVVFPPPAVPPPPSLGTVSPLWCVAKPAVPDPIIQEAMNYACGSGADCDSIQPNGSCYQPDTLINHASYAFNSYWQRTRGAGGTCDFGGTAMLITRDPSFDGCHFITIALQGIDGGE